MPNVRFPTSGSMQYWPRKKARKPYARVRYWAEVKECKPLGFAGYKVGMTHVLITDNRKESTTKDQEISIPVTILECPPIKVFSVRFYKKEGHEKKIFYEEVAANLDKGLKRKVRVPKKKSNSSIDNIKEFDEIKILVHTQPRLIGIGKKRPEIFEMKIGGSKEEQINFAKNNLGKEINVSTVFNEGEQIDVHSISKGKGYQGPVKRFGIGIRRHKSEKTKRGPGSLGGWKAQGHVMYRVPHAGQTGYHMRTEHNKWVIKISDKINEINPKGGFIRYGEVKNSFILMKGSVAGSTKRMIIMSHPSRANKFIPSDPPQINYISLDSKQG